MAPRVAELTARHSPDLLAVHDPTLALAVDGQTPLVLAGHTHRRSRRRQGDTMVITVGSSGASSVGGRPP